jgi:starvation-inducible DNA-binding protein
MEKTMIENKQYAKLGFKKIESTEIVSALNRALASYQIFFHKLQGFHWNVLGNDFYDVHDITEDMYKKGLRNIDDIAERIRIFGQTPEVRLTGYLKQSGIKESSPDKSAEYMIYDMISDIEKLAEDMLNCHESAAKNGDIGTMFMVSKMINDLESYHWKLSSWTNRKFAS